MRQMKQLLEAKANKEVAWIAPEAAVIDALRMMAEKHIGAVLVMDAGKLVGIFPNATMPAKWCCWGAPRPIPRSAR